MISPAYFEVEAFLGKREKAIVATEDRDAPKLRLPANGRDEIDL
jgi:hypothetical protein